jgi:tetratricopeptide (TPR) repeat protein
MSNTGLLDSEELLHLAIEASNKDDIEKSITLLKQALEVNPANAKAQYMLGAMHAQIGLYDRALEDMQKAVKSEPGLDTAHFQIGLLYITSGNVAAAEQAWSALDRLGEKNALFLFKRGILKLAQDQFEECIEDLQLGIRLNTLNKALNKDMQMLITQAQEAIKTGKPNDNKGQVQEANHVFLSVYDSDEK